MADKFLLEIITPSRRLMSKEVEEMTAPGFLGEFGVLAGHTQFIFMLKTGGLAYKAGSESGYIAISQGYAEVLPDKTTILVDKAETGAEIDLGTAKSMLEKAEESIKGFTLDDPEYPAARDLCDWEQARVWAREKQKG